MKGDDTGTRRKPGGRPTASARPIPRPALPPGPLDDLKGLLHQAYLAAGPPTLDDMAQRLRDDDLLPACPSRDTIARILGDRELPPKQADVLALARLLTRMTAGDADHAGREAARLWTRARLAQPLGTPVNDLNPYDLEVRRSIDPGPTTPDHPHGPHGLPDYVRRPHDERLDELVDAAVDQGHSGLAILVGTSATGKTRACWEAVRRLPEKWRLWQPLYPDRPRAVLADLARVGPRTVIWLNEAHEYLLHPEHGEAVAAGLRVLLTDDRVAPVLVLGTIWPGPGYHDDIAYPPAPGRPHPHDQAHFLLAGRAHSVPGRFTSDHVDTLRTSPDPRIAEAAHRARDGMLTQYLSAAPELLQLFDLVEPGPKALLTAAVDARRLGHPRGLPLPFLTEAAEAYLSDPEWDLLPDDWCERALTLLTRPVKGAHGPLHLQRRPRGSAPRPTTDTTGTDRVYQLADILEQHGRTTRRDARVPAIFWTAAIRHCTPDTARPLAEQAEHTGLLEQACRLWIRADEPFRVGVVLNRTGRTEEARAWFEHAAHHGDSRAAGRVAMILAEADRLEEALPWCARELAAGGFTAWEAIVGRLRVRGELDSLLVWYEAAEDAAENRAARTTTPPPTGHHPAGPAIPHYENRTRAGHLEQMAHDLATAGRWDEALEWFERAAAFRPDALRHAARRLAVVGRHEQALTTYGRTVTDGDPDAYNGVWDLFPTSEPPREAFDWLDGVTGANRAAALFTAATRLFENGDLDGALDRYHRAAEAGHPQALGRAAARLADAGHLDTALTWYERASAAGAPRALGHAAARLAEAGRLDTALTWYERAAAAGDTVVLHYAAGWLARAGRMEEAVAHWERAVDAGHLAAAGNAAEWLVHTGRLDDALPWYERAARPGTGSVRTLPVVPLALAGRWDEARAAWRHARDTGHRVTLHDVADRLAGTGGVDTALTWLAHAPDERDAEVLAHEALLNERVHRPDTALRRYREAGTAGSTHALRQAARLLAADGRLDEALGHLDDAARTGDDKALTEAASHLERAGRLDDALTWYERAVAAGNPHALFSASRALTDAGRSDEAYIWRRRAAAAGVLGDPSLPTAREQPAPTPDTALEQCERASRQGRISVGTAATTLAKTGHPHLARQLRRFGWNPDGGVAHPWEPPEPPAPPELRTWAPREDP
ncbi:tetratricopeptide repeat protein [Streptomyces sp. NPDC057217]|uniref:tetratricopeptide repeat protein n=1 Tax=Streptomyces sp. NPDC057217 TaxID=3346054 RepID=UPI0036458E69